MLYNFAYVAPKGFSPIAGVIRDSAGNLYGTASSGGPKGYGVVYKLDPAGVETVQYSFTGGADGGFPYSGVIRDSAGNLYGTASDGGSAEGYAGYGVVYKLDTSGQETVLYSFTGGADGGNPEAGVIRDSAGNLYGTASGGGTSGYGVVFKLDTAGQETVLYTFTGGADGGVPYFGVIRDSAGNLYGATYYGGTAVGYAGYGVVFKLDTAGQETVLYTFTGGADGGNPDAGVIRDSAGNLYGTTSDGGSAEGYAGYGVVFKLDTAGQETVLYTFTGGADGGSPGPVIRDSAGNLYGITYSGGTAVGYAGYGVVFKLDTARQETVLYSFTGGADGGIPEGLIRDSAGNFYGTTYEGGITEGYGVVFKLDTAGQETTYAFPISHGGSFPPNGVIRDSAGNLYGTTDSGGTGGAGVLFKLNPDGHETVLYSFTGGADGGLPNGDVIRDRAGNLYGTTYQGGTANEGVVYKVDTAGHETVLYSFTGGADGGLPEAGVIMDSAGNLYGTTLGGGAAERGTVFKLDVAGHETVLYSFTGGADGSEPPQGVLIRDSAGNLYGTTWLGGDFSSECSELGCGVVFKLDPNGHETVLCTFTGGTDGGWPKGGVIRDSAGNLYGTTYLGGTAGAGVVFKVDTASQETVLYSFTGGADGGTPYAGVIRDPAGNLYGTTSGGGVSESTCIGSGCGVVFKLDPSGQETVLYTFTLGAGGLGPGYSGVILDPAGNLYGTASGGGEYSGGVVFELMRP